MNHDAEDYPVEYLWYVFLACLAVALAIAGVAAFLLRNPS